MRNKETFRILQEEVIVRGRLELVDKVFAPDFAATRAGGAGLLSAAGLPTYPQGESSYDNFVAGYRGMMEVMTDQVRTIEEMTGEGDRLCARWSVSATHSAPFLGVPATGGRLHFREIGMMRFDSAHRIVEGWFMWDEFAIARQLGLVSFPAVAS
ncbi:ester cyclase [Streptomyces sp. NPDC048278]|uniref:ester cyclase n=1 Tax=Streptomyces sp. NPDC048278 TaxID=3155809 RepID=UPI0034242F86